MAACLQCSRKMCAKRATIDQRNKKPLPKNTATTLFMSTSNTRSRDSFYATPSQANSMLFQTPSKSSKFMNAHVALQQQAPPTSVRRQSTKRPNTAPPSAFPSTPSLKKSIPPQTSNNNNHTSLSTDEWKKRQAKHERETSKLKEEVEKLRIALHDAQQLRAQETTNLQQQLDQQSMAYKQDLYKMEREREQWVREMHTLQSQFATFKDHTESQVAKLALHNDVLCKQLEQRNIHACSFEEAQVAPSMEQQVKQKQSEFLMRIKQMEHVAQVKKQKLEEQVQGLAMLSADLDSVDTWLEQ